MEQGYAGQGTRLGIILTGVILLALGITSVIGDLLNAQTPPPAPEAIVEAQPPAAISTAASAKAAVAADSAPSAPAAADKAQGELKGLVQAWRKAWVGQDTGAYLAFYSPDFQGNAASPDEWRANRKRIIGQAKFIDIQLGQAEISMQGDDQATVTLPFDYASDRLKDHGTKVLQVRRSNGQWLIEGEAFNAN